MESMAEILWARWQHSHGLRGNIPVDWVAEIRGIRNLGKEPLDVLPGQGFGQGAPAPDKMTRLDGIAPDALLLQTEVKKMPPVQVICTFLNALVCWVLQYATTPRMSLKDRVHAQL